MLYLLFHSGFETGDNLTQSLQDRLNSNEFTPLSRRVDADRLLRRANINSSDILIRWGDSYLPELDDTFIRRGAKVINKSSSVIRNTNKLRSLELFQQAGLNTPRFWRNKRDIRCFPVLARNRQHSRGTDIKIVNGNNYNLSANNFDRIPDADYYVELLSQIRELRIHVFNDKVIAATRRFFSGENLEGQQVQERGVIKSSTFGFSHETVEIEDIEESYLDSAKKAIRAIGLNFGAVDLLISRDRELPYPLECNSAPRLSDLRLEVYTEELVNLVKPPLKKRRLFW